jgi:hypothetical protein
MRLRHYAAMLGIAIGISIAMTPGAQAAVQVNTSFPFDVSLFIPCNGDTVDASGPVHEVSALTVNGNNFSVVSHFNAAGITGTSRSTGAKYQGTGVTTETFGGSFVNGQNRDTFVNRFDFIGQGSAPNFTTHETFHITVNANGTITTTFDNLTVSCK